ncbi:response regulator transcription factor [Massilia sp. METH4]|uniref:response regulator transcription factor n=1 Tax=Massilia sp. METH4 TaxID=3123041 RepID=UPI0030D43690
MQEKPLPIYVVHPDALVAAGIGALLAARAEFDVVASTGCASACLSRPCVVVSDYAGGIQLAKVQAAAGAAIPRILIVTHHHKEAHVREALDQGAYGYLLHDCTADELYDAVRNLANGMRYLTEKVSKSIADSISRTLLTRRESDVLHLLAGGHCNKLIARELGIGVGTVKTHIKGLLTKLDAKARTHAVVIAAERGLVDPGVSSGLPIRARNQGVLVNA